mgnify:CR=1 FL=1
MTTPANPPAPVPTPPPAPAPALPAAPVPTPTPAADKQPPWGKPENFNADKAWELIENLRKEKAGTSAPDPQLSAQIEQMKKDQQAQRDALAAALGVKPEETSDADKIAQQVSALQKQVLDAERRAVSAATNVPEAMLTATDAEGIRKQADELVAFAQAAHYAAAAGAPGTPPPAFAANPGQGQGGGPLSPEAQAAAEYEKYYPSATG